MHSWGRGGAAVPGLYTTTDRNVLPAAPADGRGRGRPGSGSQLKYKHILLRRMGKQAGTGEGGKARPNLSLSLLLHTGHDHRVWGRNIIIKKLQSLYNIVYANKVGRNVDYSS